jgi:hypothetical protein
MKAMLWIAIFMSVSGSAWSQGCPNGIPAAGNPSCIPPDSEESPYYRGDEDAAPALPARMPVWAERWGAIAFGDADVGVGVSSSMSSKDAAERYALADCSKKGATGCRIDLSYYNQCSAIAWGESYATTAAAETIEQASPRALETCTHYTSSCRISYSACSLPERIQ